MTMPRVILTRPKDAAEKFAGKIRTTFPDVEICVSPVLRTQWRSADIGSGHCGVVFTSQYGVDGYMRAGGRANVPCWCVGDVTAAAAKSAGFVAKSAGGDSNALIDMMLSEDINGPILYARGAHTRGDVAGKLARAGRDMREIIVYEQVAQALNMGAQDILGCGEFVIVPLFSPRSAMQFRQQYAGHANLHIIAISDRVAREVAGMTVAGIKIAPRPDADAMLTAVFARLDAAQRLERGQVAQ